MHNEQMWALFGWAGGSRFAQSHMPANKAKKMAKGIGLVGETFESTRKASKPNRTKT